MHAHVLLVVAILIVSSDQVSAQGFRTGSHVWMNQIMEQHMRDAQAQCDQHIGKVSVDYEKQIADLQKQLRDAQSTLKECHVSSPSS